MTLYSFFWVIPGHLNFICRRFGTLCSFFMGGVSRKKVMTLMLTPEVNVEKELVVK
jgi:hypothetical protein